MLFRVGPGIVHELNEIIVDTPQIVLCDGQHLLFVMVGIPNDHG